MVLRYEIDSLFLLALAVIVVAVGYRLKKEIHEKGLCEASPVQWTIAGTNCPLRATSSANCSPPIIMSLLIQEVAVLVVEL